MRALGITSENCGEVIERLIWTIHINSDYPRDLARLKGMSVQFFQGGSAGSRGELAAKTWQFLWGAGDRPSEAFLEKLCNFSRELVVGCESLLEQTTQSLED